MSLSSKSTVLDPVIQPSVTLKSAAGIVELTEPVSLSEKFLSSDQFEQTAHASFEAALRAASTDESRALMRRALDNYSRARSLFRHTSGLEESARKARCEAKMALVNYHVYDKISLKKRMISNSWGKTKRSLELFEKIHDHIQYGRTCNELSRVPFLALSFAPHYKVRTRILREAVAFGEKAIEFLEDCEASSDLVTAYVKTASYLCWLEEYVPDSEEKELLLKKAGDYWRRGKRYSNNLFVEGGLSSESYSLHRVMTYNETIQSVKSALDESRVTGDKLALGTTLDCLACLEWDEDFFKTTNQVERRTLSKLAIEHADQARAQYTIIGLRSPLCFLGSIWSEAPLAEYYRGLGHDVETDPKKRRELLLKAIEAAPLMLRRAKASGYHSAVQAAHRVFGRILLSLATVEANLDQKRHLLARAQEEMNECANLSKRINPYFYFYNCADLADLASIDFQLAELTPDSLRKKMLFQSAVSKLEMAVKLGEKDAPRLEKAGWGFFTAKLGDWQFEQANVLGQLTSLTKSKNPARGLVRAAEGAAEKYRKLGQNNREAECWWRTAEAQQNIGDHLSASKSFETASSNYETASEKTPELKDFFREYASYMKAWTEIEVAKGEHDLSRYGSAARHYEKAASILQETEWNQAAPSYHGFGKIELGEDLSLKGLNKEAVQAFRAAEALFGTVNEDFGFPVHQSISLVKKVRTDSIRQMALRSKYCTGRALLEEAKVLHKEADYSGSATKCERAAEIFHDLGASPELIREEQDEIRQIATIASAIGTMAKADGTLSPNLFQRACRLFEKAAKQSLSTTANLVAKGHAAFCEGLGLELRFAATGDRKLRSEAIRHLESASRYYLKAGIENHSENTEATKLVLDGYMYANMAAKEADQEKRAAIFAMAEKVFHRSSALFGSTGHKGKQEEILRHIDRITSERDFAQSLSEIGPISGMSSIPTPLGFVGAFYEKPVGLDVFDNANLRAKLDVVRQRDSRGEDFEINVIITNPGKGKARLVRLERVVPEGCELVEGPAEYSFRTGCIDMAGKRLDPMCSERVRLVLRAKSQGIFTVEPKIYYMEDSGSLRSVTLDPHEVVASSLIDFLIKSFSEDYMVKRLAETYAGWRSLMDIVRSLRIPRSQVYGDSRQGRFLAIQIQRFVKAGITEVRIFPKERGRGGQITKIRLKYDTPRGKRLLEHFPSVPGEISIQSSKGDLAVVSSSVSY